jgi:hypothetical protein
MTNVFDQLHLAPMQDAQAEAGMKQPQELSAQVKMSQDYFWQIGTLNKTDSDRSNNVMSQLGFPTPSFLGAPDSDVTSSPFRLTPGTDSSSGSAAAPEAAPSKTSMLRPAEALPSAKITATTTDSSTASSTGAKAGATTDTTSTIPQSPVAGTGSTATTFGASEMPEVNQSAPGFYVSPDGSANGDGSKADPFATLQQAQQAMENSNIKTTYVEGGTYNMTSALNLTSADSGESFLSVGGASNPAVLDGGGTLSNLISLNQADNVKIEGFSMENTSNTPVWDNNKHASLLPNVGAVYVQDSSNDTIGYDSMTNVNAGVNMEGSSGMRIAQNDIENAQTGVFTGSDANNVYGSNNTVDGNKIDNITGYGGKLFNNVGAVTGNGETDFTCNNNVIENTAGVGIQLNYSQNGSGFTLDNNTLVNTDDIATAGKPDTSSNPVGDDGAIHVISSNGSTKNLNGIISNNYVDGAGANAADKGIYLDNFTNGVDVIDNAIDEGGPGYSVQIHGGSNNTLDGNTIIMGSNGKGVLYQSMGSPMTNNVIEDNDFEATGNNQKAYQFSGTDSGDTPIFSGNSYSQGINESPDPDGTRS